MATRRDMLRGGALMGASLVVPTALLELLAAPADAARPVPSGPRPRVTTDQARLLSRSTFENLGNRRFAANVGRTTVLLRLDSVEDVPYAAQCRLEGNEEAFVLNFVARKSVFPLGQRTLLLRNAELGAFSLLMVPANADGSRLSALVNRAQG